MEAYSTVSGGVLFVPEDMEESKTPVSYKEFVKRENSDDDVGVFGRKNAAEKETSLNSKQVA